MSHRKCHIGHGQFASLYAFVTQYQTKQVSTRLWRSQDRHGLFVGNAHYENDLTETTSSTGPPQEVRPASPWSCLDFVK